MTRLGWLIRDDQGTTTLCHSIAEILFTIEWALGQKDTAEGIVVYGEPPKRITIEYVTYEDGRSA